MWGLRGGEKGCNFAGKIRVFFERMEFNHYTPDDRMVSLIADNYELIAVLSRFGIKMGFGDSTVSEVCQAQGVDCRTFLSVVNFISDGNVVTSDTDDISPRSLLRYLSSSHAYFLDYCLPAIRRKLLDGIELRTSDVSFLIIKFFDEYTREVRIHMEYEEKTVFTYVSDLLENRLTPDYKINTYSDHHEQEADRLKELKGIIIKYCPESADANLLNAALYDIYRTERELESHCLIEDCLLVPAIKRLEREITGVDKDVTESGNNTTGKGVR